MPKIRITLTHEYEPDPKDYPEGSTIEEMAEMDEQSGVAFWLAINRLAQFSTQYDIVGCSS